MNSTKARQYIVETIQRQDIQQEAIPSFPKGINPQLTLRYCQFLQNDT